MNRLLVVDDVPLFRAGLASALKDAGFDVIAQAGNADGAVSAAEEYQPDLVLLDILMPGLSGLEVVEKIGTVAPGARVVLLTASESEEDLLVGIKAGAQGYVTKDAPFDDLVSALNSVENGGAAISPNMAGKLLDVTRQFLRHQELLLSRKPVLTGRELEVLQLVAQGQTSRDVGRLLYISENTVKNHIRNILDKLGLHSRNEAVLYAVREDLISLS